MISTVLAARARVIFTIIYQKYLIYILCIQLQNPQHISQFLREKDVYINLQLQSSLQVTADLIS